MQLISRQEAIARNLNKYFTGQPCIHSHISERYVGNNACIECKSIQKKGQKARQKQERINKYGKNGQTKYFTGEACVNGHFAERYITNGRCKECISIQKKGQKASQKQERIDKYGKNGQTRYFTGEACPKGHIAERYIANGHCIECKKEQSERQRRAKGVLPKDEANRLRKEATSKKKKEKQQKYEESLLNAQEKEIVKYARDCLKDLITRALGRYFGFSRYGKILVEIESGYSANKLYSHLSSQNKQWARHLQKNKGKWHIDHIIPLSKLVKLGVTEVSILNSLENLKITLAYRNLKKGSRLTISARDLDEFIRRRRLHLNHPPLGLYKPSERIKKLLSIESNRIYPVVVSELKRTKFSIKQNKQKVLGAIESDIVAGYDYYFDTGSPKEGWLEFCQYPNAQEENSKLYELILLSYSPLNKLKSRRLKDINSFSVLAQTRCHFYYDNLIEKETDSVCRNYLYGLRKDNCMKR